MTTKHGFSPKRLYRNHDSTLCENVRKQTERGCGGIRKSIHNERQEGGWGDCEFPEIKSKRDRPGIDITRGPIERAYRIAVVFAVAVVARFLHVCAGESMVWYSLIG
jgi:hypothetical protein